MQYTSPKKAQYCYEQKQPWLLTEFAWRPNLWVCYSMKPQWFDFCVEVVKNIMFYIAPAHVGVGYRIPHTRTSKLC